MNRLSSTETAIFVTLNRFLLREGPPSKSILASVGDVLSGGRKRLLVSHHSAVIYFLVVWNNWTHSVGVSLKTEVSLSRI